MKNKLLLFVCCVGVACTSRHENDIVAVAKCPADTMQVISFARDVQPIFTQYCALSGCHDAVTRQSNLNLAPGSAYQSLMRTGSGYIDTLDPRSSLLYSQMRSLNTPMPPTGLLDSCTADLVLQWISKKALNN